MMAVPRLARKYDAYDDAVATYRHIGSDEIAGLAEALAYAAADLLDLRWRVRRPVKTAAGAGCDHEVLALVERLLEAIDGEATWRDRAARGQR